MNTPIWHHNNPLLCRPGALKPMHGNPEPGMALTSYAKAIERGDTERARTLALYLGLAK